MLHGLPDAAARRLGRQRLPEAWYEQAVDRLVSAYVEWRAESLESREAYSRYAATRGPGRRHAFAVYFAALDREERAAAAYAACVGQFYALVSRHGGVS
jgi:hypothetical protein